MRIGQGKENARQFLRDNPAMADDLEAKLRRILIQQRSSAEETEQEESEN